MPGPSQLSPQARRDRARVAALTRSRTPDDPDLVAARRAVVADRLERHVRRDAGDLTPAQRGRIAALLADATAANEAAS